MTGMPYVLAKGPTLVGIEAYLNPADPAIRFERRLEMRNALEVLRDASSGDYEAELTELVGLLVGVGLGAEDQVRDFIFRWTGLHAAAQQVNDVGWGSGWWASWRGIAPQIILRGLSLAIEVSMTDPMALFEEPVLADGTGGYEPRDLHLTWKCPGPRLEVWVESTPKFVLAHLVTPGPVASDGLTGATPPATQLVAGLADEGTVPSPLTLRPRDLLVVGANVETVAVDAVLDAAIEAAVAQIGDADLTSSATPTRVKTIGTEALVVRPNFMSGGAS